MFGKGDRVRVKSREELRDKLGYSSDEFYELNEIMGRIVTIKEVCTYMGKNRFYLIEESDNCLYDKEIDLRRYKVLEVLRW